MIEVIVLGSGGSIPTAKRNHPAILLRHESWNFLFDAGEDVQRSFEKVKAGLNRKLAVFISHTHLDHLLGLPGLMLRMSLLGRTEPLNVYGPQALLEYIKVNQASINLGTTFQTVVFATAGGVLFQENGARVRSFPVDHRGLALGYEFTYSRATGTFLPEKASALGVPKGPLWGKLASGESVETPHGKVVRPEDVTDTPMTPLKIVYSGDTRPCENVRHAAKNANLLIHEAMYTRDHEDLAQERGHSTAAQAAQLAKEAEVGTLLLTHYSPRYEGPEIIEEARSIFPNSILAKDFLRLVITLDGNITVDEID